MEEKDSEGKRLLALGITQGTILDLSLLSADQNSNDHTLKENAKEAFRIIGENSLSGDRKIQADIRGALASPRILLLVCSQNCDIAAASDLEPTIEFTIARSTKSDAPEKRNLDGRSSRYLELSINNKWFRATNRKNLFVEKRALVEILQKNEKRVTIDKLSASETNTLATWKANRYKRNAFPDSFEAMLIPLKENPVFDDGLPNSGGIYINVDPFGEAAEYKVRIFALEAATAEEGGYDAVYKCMEKLIEALDGMEGVSCPILTEELDDRFMHIMPAMRRSELTIEDRDNFLKWNLDFLSIREGRMEEIEEE